jgi:hypothetical protein
MNLWIVTSQENDDMGYKIFLIEKLAAFLLGIFMLSLFSGCGVIGGEIDGGTQSKSPHLNALSIREHWPQAQELAQMWHTDAYLHYISVDVELPQVASSKNESSFAFQSPSNEKMGLVVYCSKSCYSHEVTSTISLPQCPPLEINDSLLESEEALNLGLTNGGIDYVNNKNASVTLKLERNYPRCDGSTVTWMVTFGNIVTFERVRFIFDAVSGELLETR